MYLHYNYYNDYILYMNVLDAFDIAGKGIASAVSMIEAVKLAAKYAPHFTDRQAY